MTEDQVDCENSIFPNISMTFTTKRIISHSVSLLAEDVGGKIVVVLDRKEGPWHRCMRIRPVSRLAAGSLRVITELHGRMATLQNYRETGNLLFSRGKHARGTRLLDALLSVRIVRVGKVESLQIEIGEEYFIARS